MNGKGYVATGGTGGSGSLVWEYRPSTDRWEELANFEGSSRMNAVAFVINDKAFIATGQSSSYYFEDTWEFFPDEEENDYKYE